MMTYCHHSFVKWFFFAFLVGQSLSLPKIPKNEYQINKVNNEFKRDTSSSGGTPVVSLLKGSLYNPYFFYPPFVPGKPFLYPPFLTPSDLLLNRFGKSVSSTVPTKLSNIDSSDPSLISSYFKAKKDEFLQKLFERLANTSESAEMSKRSILNKNNTMSNSTKPIIDSSYFLKKKYEFLDTLFKNLNITPAPTIPSETESSEGIASTTPKPTIVPPDFWFPFAKLPKPSKAPKPTKPPKAKKILKDALDTILLQSLLLDMGVDPKDAALNKRTIAEASMGKKSKSKKIKPLEDPTEFYIPAKIDPELYSSKASDCLDKLFKILNKAKDEDLETFVTPKATVIPTNLWTQPSETEYTSKLDAFLDLLIKSLNVTEESESSGKSEIFKKPKSKPGKKIKKRSTFLDELLHRVTTQAPITSTTAKSIQLSDEDLDPECDFIKFIEDCCCGGKCSNDPEKLKKATRSLIFKPFGTGYWIPQYLYAAKMGMYLDKLMDTINKEAVTELESSDVMKRSLSSATDDSLNEMSSKETALNLIIAELTELKNNIIDAFSEGIQAQKDAIPNSKPFGPSSKSFKKPFWGPKALPTSDPIAPIQKRIDILNDIFDKLTKVEKTLIFTSEPEYDPKLIGNLTEILELTSPKGKLNKSKFLKINPTENFDSPAYFLTKTKEYLQNLYVNKDESDDINTN